MYIVVTYFGLPYTEKEKPPNIKEVRRHEIALRTWEDEHLFDSDSHYRCFADNVPSVTTLQRCLARTFYDPLVPLKAEWRRVGDFHSNDLITAVKKGLEHDDDIIQQWFEAPQVLKLLTAAKDWNETLLAVEAIGGRHEDTPEVAAYVHRVLPNLE